MWTELAPDLFVWPEAVNVYAIRRGDEAILVDSGAGEAVRHLAELGVRRVAHVLHTHHHRDQCAASAALAAQGTAVWAPAAEAELLGDPEGMWQVRPLLNSYSGRTDRDAPLEPIPLRGRLEDYAVWTWLDVRLQVVPAPGHTMGSAVLLWETGPGGKLAFTGDLLYAPGKVWSLASFQYDYNGLPGAVLAVRSLEALAALGPVGLLPSHGRLMGDAPRALRETAAALRRLLDQRDPGLAELSRALERPLEVVTPHLLRDRFSVSSNWVLLSGDGHALWIDYGYPHGVYITQAGGDRASKRALLHGLEQLREAFGVGAVDAVVVTHHHDDHVAAIPALRRVTGAEVWAPEPVVPVLQDPEAYKTQCLWYDPIPVDRVLREGEPVAWRGYTLRAYAQPGHTRYAGCILFEVDGLRALAIGDQFPHNYIYANGFALGDYTATVGLWQRLAPDLILPGHGPAQPAADYLARFAEAARDLDELHRRLLPLDEVDLGVAGEAASIRPYHVRVAPGGTATVRVEVCNPYAHLAEVRVRLVWPAVQGWRAEPPEAERTVAPRQRTTFDFTLRVDRTPRRRARYAVDLHVAGQAFGQVAEGFVTVQ